MTSKLDSMLSSDSEEEAEEVDVSQMKDYKFMDTRKKRDPYRPVDEDASSDEDDDQEDEEESGEDEEQEEKEGDELGDLDHTPVLIEPSTSKTTFAELGVHSWLVDQLNVLQITKPTPVQVQCIPKIIDGSDVLGCAKTGTGKTLTFALPILNRLATDPYGIYAVILTPTRELAAQIADQFISLGKPISLKVSVIEGGKCIITQAGELERRPHIVIATPGRLADHILNNESLANIFSKLEFFVLDEADRLLDGQYNSDLKIIFDAMPKKRQTLLFSATLSSSITQLHKLSVRKPYFFEDKSDVFTVEKLEQKYVICPQPVKDAYLVYVVKNYTERNPNSSILVFTETCREAHALTYMFNGLGFEVAVLHSQIPQRVRSSSLLSFRNKTMKVLICTDVAARGLDIPHVDLVINHNVPKCPKTYVHRVGRSARAGRYGSALNFITQYDVALLQAIEEYVGKKFEQLKVSDKNVTKYAAKVLLSKREAELKLERQNFGEKKEINKKKELMMSGMTEDEADEYMSKRKQNRKDKSDKKRQNTNHEIHKRKKEQEASTSLAIRKKRKT